MSVNTAHRNAARFVGPLERILYLKSLPAMEEASIDLLTSVAEYLEERTYRRGQVLMARDRPVDAIHFVVSGRVRATYKGTTISVAEPPAMVGFVGALSRVAGEYEVVAEIDTRTLSIQVDTYFDIIEDSFAMMLAGIRTLTRQLVIARDRLPGDGSGSDDILDAEYPETPLDLVERLVWACRPGAVFENSNIDAVMQICRRQTEKRWQPGERIYSEGDRADFGFAIRWGTVRCWGESGKRAFTAGPGFGMGFLDGFAGIARHINTEAVTEVVAVISSIQSITNILEDNVDVAFDLSARMATSLLEIYSEVGLEP